MKINQIFRHFVPESLLIKILKCFNIEKLEEGLFFVKKEFDDNESLIVDSLRPCIDELYFYYLPCKSSIYLDEITFDKAITVLRQILKTRQYSLNAKPKRLNSQKMMEYTIVKLEQPKQNISIQTNVDCKVNFSN